MGRHFWGSEGQKQSLLQFKGEYVKHRLAKKTRKFWPKFFTFWFRTYPEDRLIKRQRMTQCKTFMANHTGTREDGVQHVPPPADAPPPPHPPPPPTSPASQNAKSKRERRRLRKSSCESKILSLIRGRSKKYSLPLHQAYSHLYYDKVEHIIEASWKEHVNILKKSNTTYTTMSKKEIAELAKDERLTVVNRELRCLFAAETDKVKEEVGEYRQKHALGDDMTLSETEKRANATKNTASLMKTLLPCLHRETGMIVTVLATGRSPSSEAIVFRSFHVGRSEFGANFAQWYPKWDSGVKDEYLKFFESVEKATMDAAENATQSSGCGVLLKPTSHESADDQEGAGIDSFEDFGGMDEDDERDDQAADVTDEEKPEGKRNGKKVDWENLFKLNRIVRQEIDEEVSKHEPRSNTPPLSSLPPNHPTPASPQRTTSSTDQGAPSTNLPSPDPPPPNPPPPTTQEKDGADRNPRSPSPPLPSQPATPSVSNNPTPRVLSQRNAEANSSAHGQKRKEVADDGDVDVDEDEDEDVPYVTSATAFLEKVLGHRCPTLLGHWAMFEEMKKYPQSRTKALGSDKLCPKELTALIAHHDYSDVPIPKDPVEYGKQWREWYIDAQPSCRGSTWLLRDTRQLPSTCSWKSLSHGGRNGILVAILGIAIWLLSAEDLKNSAGRKITQEIEEALKDVDSVILTMLHDNEKENKTPSRPIKRPRRK